MKRRQLLVALGATAGGSSALFGTSAFTSVNAERRINVQVANDANAFLSMKPSNGPNGAYAANEDGRLVVQLDGSDDTPAGGGVNDNAVTELRDVFRIRNQSPQQIFVFFEEFGSDAVSLLGGTTTAKNNGSRIYDAPPSGLVPSERPSMEGSNNALRTPVGAPIPVSIKIDTTGSNALDDLAGNLTVRAQIDPPQDSPFAGSRFDPDSN
jgi:hypothetical protein